MTRINEKYWGCRIYRYMPVVASTPFLVDWKRVSQAFPKRIRPPIIRTLLAMCMGLKCGSPLYPRKSFSKCPLLWLKSIPSLFPNNEVRRYMVNGNPYISANKATINAPNERYVTQSVFVLGLKAAFTKYKNRTILNRTNNQLP